MMTLKSDKLSREEKRELASFLPDRIYDSHVHIWKISHVKNEFREKMAPKNFGVKDYFSRMGRYLPGKEIIPLMFPYVFLSDYDAASSYLFSQTEERKIPVQIVPNLECDRRAKQIEAELENHPLVMGIKTYPYQLKNVNEEADMSLYLPEDILEVANEVGLTWTVHLPRNPPIYVNQINRMINRFPNVRFNFAHSMRMRDDAKTLAGMMENIEGNYFVDISTVLNKDVLVYLYDNHLPKVIWGSDAPVSFDRHIIVPLKNGSTKFIDTPYEGQEYYMRGIYESLMAYPRSKRIRISREIFYNNPRRYIYGRA